VNYSYLGDYEKPAPYTQLRIGAKVVALCVDTKPAEAIP